MKLLAAAVCLGLAMPGVAGAAQRYAAAAGAGPEPCTKEAPCSLKDAVTEAKTGDEVIVLSGTYAVGQNIYPPEAASNVYVHGDFAGPIPVVSGSLSGGVMSIYGVKDRLAYLDVSNTGASPGNAVGCSYGAEVDRVRATAMGEGAKGIDVAGNCVVRDSVAVGSGTSATGLRARGLGNGQLVSLRNVTAVAGGAGSTGLRAELTDPGVYPVDAVNTIASGDLADVVAEESAAGAARVVMSYSNFDLALVGPEKRAQVVEGAGVQKAPALFVNPAAGDYREAAGSPTIDAGSNDTLGPLDLAGSARILGGAPDIGAYEFVPPVAQLRSLAIKPGTFMAGSVAGAVTSRKKKAAAPTGATVSYALSAAGDVDFTFERKSKGRKAGTKCVKQTAANKGHKACALYKPVRGSFSVSGNAGQNKFRFSGKLGGRSLKPGSYHLVGSAGGAVKKAAFKIVK